MNVKSNLVLAAAVLVSLAGALPAAAQQAGAPMKPMDGSEMTASKYSFTETIARLRQAIAGEDLMVIHDIDGQAMMKMAGKDVGPMRQVFFFHPRYMRAVYEANPMAGIAIPPKFVVMEQNGRTMLRYFKPSSFLKPYQGTEEIAKELDGKVERIVGSVR